MIIYIFGNPDLKFDSLPVKILPKLRKKFPNIKFKIKDPNEEWDTFMEHGTRNTEHKTTNTDHKTPNYLYIIDTVIGLKNVAVFNDISVFKKSPAISLHDFDLYADLILMKKLGKLSNLTVIGIPPDYTKEKAYNEITNKILKINYYGIIS